MESYDDESFSGGRPDPASRPWRHPSELAALNAAADNNARRSYPLWPGAVAGVCMVTVTATMLATSSISPLGHSSPLSQSATVIATTNTVVIEAPASAGGNSSSGPLSGQAWRPGGEPVGPNAEGTAADMSALMSGSAGGTELGSVTADGAQRNDPTATIPGIGGGVRTGQTHDEVSVAVGDSADLAATTPKGDPSIVDPAPRSTPSSFSAVDATETRSWALYPDTATADSRPLAAMTVVATDAGLVAVTSRAAIGDARSIKARSEAGWRRFTVRADDALSDIAVLEPVGYGVGVDVGTTGFAPGAVDGTASVDPTNGASVCVAVINLAAPVAAAPTADSTDCGIVDEPLATVDGDADNRLSGAITTTIMAEPTAAGAAVVDQDGGVVGLAIGRNSTPLTVLPIDMVTTVVNDLVTAGTVERSWIGIATEADGARIIVHSVESAGPSSGVLEPGDRVVAIGDVPVDDVDRLLELVRTTEPGQELTVTVERSGRRLLLEVVTAPLSSRSPGTGDRD